MTLPLVSAYGANKASAQGALVWLVVSLAVLAFIATMASGSVLSAVESPLAAVSLLHKIAPCATALLTAIAFYCLLRGGV
jgi:hypothetical protein